MTGVGTADTFTSGKGVHKQVKFINMLSGW